MNYRLLFHQVPLLRHCNKVSVLLTYQGWPKGSAILPIVDETMTVKPSKSSFKRVLEGSKGIMILAMLENEVACGVWGTYGDDRLLRFFHPALCDGLKLQKNELSLVIRPL